MSGLSNLYTVLSKGRKGGKSSQHDAPIPIVERPEKPPTLLKVTKALLDNRADQIRQNMKTRGQNAQAQEQRDISRATQIRQNAKARGQDMQAKKQRDINRENLMALVKEQLSSHGNQTPSRLT
jgi:hypothetical protein